MGIIYKMLKFFKRTKAKDIILNEAISQLEFYKTAFVFAHDPILILDGHKVINFNKKAEEYFGVDSLSSTIERIIISTEIDLNYDKVDEVIEIYTTARNKDGNTFRTSVVIRPIVVNGKQLLFIVFRDMQIMAKICANAETCECFVLKI